MAKPRGEEYEGWDDWTPCIICEKLQPNGKFHQYPWHITCDDDDVGKKKAVVWMREQKALKKSAVPTFALPD